MKLSEYLIKYGITKAKLCKDANILPQTLYNLFKGKGLQLKTAVNIEKATKGMVTCKDLYFEFVKRPRKPYTKKLQPLRLLTNLDIIEEKEKQVAHVYDAPHGMIYQNTDSSLA